MFPYLTLEMFESIRASDVCTLFYISCIIDRSWEVRSDLFGSFYCFLPDVDPDDSVVQLKEFCKTCFFTHTATFILCVSGQMANRVCSILILQRAAWFTSSTEVQTVYNHHAHLFQFFLRDCVWKLQLLGGQKLQPQFGGPEQHVVVV